MDDKTLQRKLNQLVKLCNELDVEAKHRYGQQGFLFFESESGFHIMDGDASEEWSTSLERQEKRRFTSRGLCSLHCGSW